MCLWLFVLVTQVQLVGLEEESSEFVCRNTFDHPYPTTKIMWIPDTKGVYPDLLATSGDYLRIWRVRQHLENYPLSSASMMLNIGNESTQFWQYNQSILWSFLSEFGIQSFVSLLLFSHNLTHFVPECDNYNAVICWTCWSSWMLCAISLLDVCFFISCMYMKKISSDLICLLFYLLCKHQEKTAHFWIPFGSQVSDTETRLECLLNNNKNSDFCAPLTSFDWNEVDPNLLGKNFTVWGGGGNRSCWRLFSSAWLAG